MSLRLRHALIILSAACFLNGLPAFADNDFGTPASFMIPDRPRDLSIEVYYVVHRPTAFPNALFLVEFRRADSGEWKRSIGKMRIASHEEGMNALAVAWTSGPLKGETAVLEILSSKTAKWKDGKTENEDAFNQPPFGQQFAVKAEKVPPAISNRLTSMRTTSLHRVILEIEGL